MIRPVILDCSAEAMTAEEKALFKELEPYGFILFARNCQSPDQLRRLTDDMREVAGREDVPILIDQEGGRVCRLTQKYWRKPPSGEQLLALFLKDSETGLDAARINARLIAEDLREMGIKVNCAPLLDLRIPGADMIIGDRSYGHDGDIISKLAMATCEGLFAGGVLPVIKHIPGHGRADVDSHLALPVVQTPLEILRETDFIPFKALNHMPLAMTAHIVYSATDPDNPATLSEKLIHDVIRTEIGFQGVLISDDVTMKALSGGAAHNARRAIEAGCDLVLHCNAGLDERRQVLEEVNEIDPAKMDWLKGKFSQRRDVAEIDRAELINWLDGIL